VKWGRSDWLALLGLAGVILVAYRELWLGTATIKFDADDLFAPYYMLAADHARHGQLMLWDPWTLGGSAVTAYPELGTFSPLLLAFGLVGGSSLGSFLAYCLFLVWFGATGMYVLTRSLGTPVFGAFLAGVGFQFSGYGTGHLPHTSWLCTFVFIPWVIWRLDVALRAGRIMPAIQGGALWGLSALSGYPCMVLVAGMIAFVWAFGFFAMASTPADGVISRLRRAAIYLITWTVTGFAVMAPAYIGFITEARGYSDRHAVLPYDVAVNDNALNPLGFMTFASPHPAAWLLKLHEAGQREWLQPTDPSSISIYVAPVILWLALASLVVGWRDSRRWWLVVIAAIGCGLAVGDVLPLRGWFYQLVPPSRYFRHSSQFTSMATFAVCVLGGFGAKDVDGVLGETNERKRFAWFLTAASLILVVMLEMTRTPELALTLLKARVPSPPATGLAILHGALVWCGIIPLAILAAMPQRWPGARRWFAVGAIALVSADAVLHVAINRPLMLGDGDILRVWRDLEANAQHGLDLTRNNGVDRSMGAGLSSLVSNKHLALRAPMLDGYSSLGNRRLEPLAKLSTKVPLALGKDRFFFAKDVVSCPPSTPAFDAFLKRCGEVGGIVGVVHPRADMKPDDWTGDDRSAEIAKLPKAVNVPIELRDYTPTTMRFRVVVPEAGWLFVTDRWSPGWQATVNDEPSEVFGGLFVFRAVRVRAGANDVAFDYRPFGYPWLMVMSWTILFGAAASLVAARFIGRSPSSS
jgi:hypothetical protein